MEESVFKDPKIEMLFQKNGFVVMPLLTQKEADELLRYYDSNPITNIEGFHATHFSKNRAYKKEVNQQIISAFKMGLSQLLNDYNLVFANFMVKEVGVNSAMPLHSDWTYVDENKHQSLGIWSPLVDTNLENGMLGVVPFSHRLKKNNRGPKIPSPFLNHNEYIINTYGVLLKVKAGNVVIYDHRLLHFSPANLSNSKRVSINIAAAPKGIEIVHYAFFEEKKQIYKYEVSSNDFFIRYNHFQEPDDGKVLDTLDLNLVPFEKTYIDEVLKSKTLLDKLKIIFLKNKS